MNFDNFVIVQFNLLSNKTTNPLRAHKIALMESNKYTVPAKFYGVLGGSKFGVNLHREATHWGLFDVTDPNNPKVVLYDEFEQDKKIRKVYKIANHYAVMQKYPRFYKFRISEYCTLKDLTSSLINQFNKENS